MRVGDILPSSYIARCKNSGKPINSKQHQGNRWRPIDIVARARAECLDVYPPFEDKVKIDVAALIAKKAQLETEKAQLEKSISGLRHILSVNSVSSKLTGATLLTEPEIAAGKIDLPNSCGVYFLLRANRVVYVGQSVNIWARITSHFASKDFDGVAYVPCDRKHLDILESLYIHTLRPELNGRWKGKTPGMHAPLRLDVLLAG